MELFKIRFRVESLLREYFSKHLFIDRSMPVAQMLNYLLNNEIEFPRRIISSLKDVVAICNAAIHGGPISEKQINLVLETAPGLIVLLEKEALF